MLYRSYICTYALLQHMHCTRLCEPLATTSLVSSQTAGTAPEQMLNWVEPWTLLLIRKQTTARPWAFDTKKAHHSAAAAVLRSLVHKA
jgi:hypothetical protein